MSRRGFRGSSVLRSPQSGSGLTVGEQSRPVAVCDISGGGSVTRLREVCITRRAFMCVRAGRYVRRVTGRRRERGVLAGGGVSGCRLATPGSGRVSMRGGW